MVPFENALLTLISLPFALIGGAIAVAITSGVVIVASLVGFITLVGIALTSEAVNLLLRG